MRQSDLDGRVRRAHAHKRVTRDAGRERAHESEPGIVAYTDGELVAVIALTLKAGAIRRVYVVADPRKLELARRSLAG